MPFVSKAQRRKFYADPRLHQYIAEYESATKGPLPERVGQKIKLRRKKRRRLVRRR